MNCTVSGGLSHLVEAATALTQLVDVNGKKNPSATSTASPEPQSQRTIVSDDEEESKKIKQQLKPNSTNSREIFPQRLMQILDDSELTDVISWLPHGRSFVIIRPDVFAEKVLPRYFPSTDSRSSTKYPSFTRKLNRWGFRQATRGPDTGAFHHPFFKRDEPKLCLDMVCQKSRKQSASSKGNKRKASSSTSTSKAPSINLFNKDASATNRVFPLTKDSLAALASTQGPRLQLGDSFATVSLDGSVACSNGLSVSGEVRSPYHNSHQNFAITPTLSPWVPTDPNLVAATLLKREENERLTVAKSMLYEAYLTALRG
mmetsp:Transcript_24093/g.35695  ORF Transcript_24093/g.35695 Transcript_24093/m.35695 type:complete len:316 (-) Transcript_24093:248-1195(-)|eukprot:CAMPEP_0194218746 /NCGR_PEP_ID=MMETSP0156-20130528/24499_1 /TAXON_ID=33649 /ORGANISM="Thalassionema nitzschioides, Strain L26-B" /LENGTH=315 /DNA_ID=CAMNT_0038948211 /DNA_START=51 /DNA_END=998 /DNA_ORIENTATION=+